MKEIKKLGRRKFFVTASISAAGLAILNKIPFVSLGRGGVSKSKINVNINPSAVKRTK